ncbi:hypothetical protein SAMN02927937_01668 [Paenimyroides aquimaris]|uniref:Uncharacterized protein n=1 Tax=Paenimyroides marinum TaxID=1159016 RepID=A0A1H6L4I2_9FLAO|nr:hypothetical protein [Paenimyroides aquimaris]SEH83176.1 hypothetical protein SAMN02927937_01668 [Paenimyroides aquimaris]
MKQLTTQQIDQLFEFTKKHLVEHYDVQVELVDHLANAIEDQWKQNPNISFEDALQTEFKKFGIFGFTGLVEQKQAALKNHYWKIIKKEFINFFSVPKVILTVVMFYVLFQFYSNPKSFLYNYDLLIRFGFIALTLGVYIYQRVKTSKNKKFLVNSVANYLYGLPIFALFYLRTNLSVNSDPSLFKIVLSSVFTQILILFLLILYTKIIPLLKYEINQTELNFSKL